MKFAQGIFKAYDIRGVANQELTTELAQACGRAFADWLPASGAVAVGRDMRPDSAELAAAFRQGLVEQGREVVDIGLVSTDMIYFAVGHYKFAGGAMVTASHNPGEYNGIKLCNHESLPVGLESGGAEIRRAIEADKYKSAATPGQLQTKDIGPEWAQHILSFVDVASLKPYRIAVDAGNGMGGAVWSILEPHLPFEVQRLYFELDGSFPNHPANPMVAANLTDLIQTVRTHQLDFGLAFDGDGDRAFLVDEKGQIVTGSMMAAILAARILRDQPGAAIVYDVRMSRLVADTITKFGGQAIKSKVGHPYIVEAMLAHDAPFGAEATGHFYFERNFFADSAMAAALMAIGELARSGQSLSELAAPYQHYHATEEINRPVEDLDKVVALLTQRYSRGQLSYLDGLSVEFDDWWFNLRASNTEPTLRLNVEADSQELLDAKIVELLNIIRS